MIDENIYSFKEALEKTKNIEYQKGELHLLFGNGLSMDKYENFNYKNIFLNSDKTEISDTFTDLFKKCKYNFEKVIRILQKEDELDDAEHIQLGFLEIFLTKTHPKSALALKLAHKNSCATFFLNFTQLYTTNYDLLPYWVNMIIPKHKDNNQRKLENRLRYTDGFSKNNDEGTELTHVWFNNKFSKTAELLYLHGAVHLFKELRNIGDKQTLSRFDYKLTYGDMKGLSEEKPSVKITGTSLISQVKKRFYKKSYPVMVFEGDSDSKQKIIEKSLYLSFAFRNFSYLKDDLFHSHKGRILFIHGHSLGQEDTHIVQAINNSHTVAIFCSVFQKDQQHIEHIKNIINKDIDLYFYNAESANVWNNNNLNFYLQ